MLVSATIAAVPAYSQSAADSAHTHVVQHPSKADLVKESQNPLGALIAIPIQWNGNMNTRPLTEVPGSEPPASDRTTTQIDFEPAVPVHLGEDWNLITRLILPVKFQPVGDDEILEETETHVGGLSDSNLSFYLSPAKPGALIWGAGPSFLLPTATESVLGTGKWGGGPTVVVLGTPGKFVLGSLWTQIWSFAGSSERASVSSLSWQYFINYNLPKGWSLVMTPTITVDWKASSGNKWTVPVGGGGSYMGHIGHQLFKLALEFYWNAARPEGAAAWAWQFELTPIWK